MKVNKGLTVPLNFQGRSPFPLATITARKRSSTCQVDYIPKGACASFSSLQRNTIRAISPFSAESTEITSDLPLPGATASLMNRRDVITPPAKRELRTNLESSLKLLLQKIWATQSNRVSNSESYINVSAIPAR